MMMCSFLMKFLIGELLKVTLSAKLSIKILNDIVKQDRWLRSGITTASFVTNGIPGHLLHYQMQRYI